MKLAHQCDFSDIDECLIDAIIFGTNCLKAQDKLLQTPKKLNLQQCLTVCQHYESLKLLHIQQIRPGSSKYIELLKKCHPKKKPRSSQNDQKWQSRSQPADTRQQSQRTNKTQKKFYWCGHNLHKDRACECPAWGHNCRKCNKLNHWENMCGQLLPRRRTNQDRGRENNHSMVSEIRNSSLMSNVTSNNPNTVPKQVLDVVGMANLVDNLSHYYRRQLELDTLNMTSPTQIFSNVKIDGVLVRGKQDTGAEINVMPLNIYDQLNLKLKGKLQLKPCNDVKVIGYSKQSVSNVGKVTVTCTHATKQAIFYVTDLNDTKILLGLSFCKLFDLVKIQCDEHCVCKKVVVDILNEAIHNEFPRGLDVPSQEQTRQQFLPVDINTKLRADCKTHIRELFPKLFEGIGTIKDAIVKLDVDQSVTPIVQPPRKVPQAMVEPLKQEIDRMTSLGVIRKLNINEATDWCHNLVLVHKPNGKLWVCLDPRTINKALRFNVHNARTFQDMTSSIKKVAKVSKIDANSGFWTLPMDEDSQILKNFNTPWGRYCFTKMPFRLNQVQYFFQYYMDSHFQDINSTTNVIVDNVMIHGESDQQHDKHLLQVLNKCREIGLKLNSDKCVFGQKKVQFYGNTISTDGIKPDPSKVDIIIQMPSPSMKTELASFLGMCNYISPYIPRLSDVTVTLRELNKKNVEFTWNSTYEKVFKEAKLHIANAVTLQYFDPMKSIVLECDASGNGVSGTLLQDGQPIVYVSQALTET